jgi:hypothetical protein
LGPIKNIHPWAWQIEYDYSKVADVDLPTGGEREDLVRTFSPGSTLESGLKVFRRRGPKCSLVTPPLVPVAITNRDKGAASQRHFPAMTDAGF